jgi:hypothetical protein
MKRSVGVIARAQGPKQSFLRPILFAIGCLFCAGCAPLIIGAAVGGGAAYMTSKDTMQVDTDKSFNAVYSAALMVAKIRGNVKQEDSYRGSLYVETDNGKVWINIIRLTRSTVRLKVSARKFHMPNIELAQDICAKIIAQAGG